MKATIDYADELVKELEAACVQLSWLKDASERMNNALDAARQTHDSLVEANERAHIDRPFLWVRRVTNATASSMSAASALATAFNLCPAEKLAERQTIRDIEIRLRELNARILAEPRPVVPGAPPTDRPRVAEPLYAPAEFKPTPPPVDAPSPVSLLLSADPDEPDTPAAQPVQPAPISIAAVPYGEQAVRVPVAEAVEEKAPALTMASWDDLDDDVPGPPSPEPVKRPAVLRPRPLPKAEPKWRLIEPPRPQTLARLAVVFLFIGFVAAVSYPPISRYINKARGDRLGARIAKLNVLIKQQKDAIAQLDAQMTNLKGRKGVADRTVARLEATLTPEQRIGSELADVQYSIASLSASDAQLRQTLSQAPPGQHDQTWQINTAMVQSNARRLAALNDRQNQLESKLQQVETPEAVQTGITQARQEVDEIETEIQENEVNRKVLVNSVTNGQRYIAELRVERDHAYHPTLP